MSDQWILQLIADMSRKKSTKKFKRLNQILTERSIKNITQQGYEKKPIKIYLENLKIIYKKHQELLSTKRNIAEIDPLSIKQITDVPTSISSIITTINENSRKKVEKINSILDSLRLKSLQEILKPEEKQKAE